MKPIRRIAWVALTIAYVHAVFGAIVRISGSGMGCGEHWPDCNGTFVPTVTNYTVAVEATHRFLAGMLLGITGGLVVLAWTRRSTPGVAGRGGVLRPAGLALALVVTAALVGMVVVKLSLASPLLIVVHYSIAMATLGALAVAVVRAGGFGGPVANVSPTTYRGAAAAAGLAFITVLLGALTANMPTATHVRLTHQALAVLLFLHLLGLAIATTKRHESPVIVRAAQLAFAIVLLQLVLGITLLALHLPPALQSLHQATGTLLWVTVFTFAVLAKRSA